MCVSTLLYLVLLSKDYSISVSVHSSMVLCGISSLQTTLARVTPLKYNRKLLLHRYMYSICMYVNSTVTTANCMEIYLPAGCMTLTVESVFDNAKPCC